MRKLIMILLVLVTLISTQFTVQADYRWNRMNNRWYYVNSNGHRQQGWRKINNKWYLFYNNGAMVTGWAKRNGKWYYMNSDGAMHTGWKKLNKKWYYLNKNGDMATGWKKVRNKWYFLNKNGDMATGWKKVRNEWYYLYKNGDMASSSWINNKYYVDESGKWLKNETPANSPLVYEHKEGHISYFKVPIIPNSYNDKFRSCKQLHTVYPAGVQKGHPAYNNYRNGDRDKDGWACEVKGISPSKFIDN